MVLIHAQIKNISQVFIWQGSPPGMTGRGKESMSKQSRAREFNKNARQAIIERDMGKCIFCQMKYHIDEADSFALRIFSIMHYIPRAHNGLGIPENGAIGCQFHHDMLDNGKQGRREEMLEMFKRYLKQFYPSWDEQDLVYRKWKE